MEATLQKQTWANSQEKEADDSEFMQEDMKIQLGAGTFNFYQSCNATAFPKCQCMAEDLSQGKERKPRKGLCRAQASPWSNSREVQRMLRLARVRTGGHFDKIIVSIDKIIDLLRKVEAADIEHRDRCKNSDRRF